jgi:hypothetical protein
MADPAELGQHVWRLLRDELLAVLEVIGSL